MLDANGANVHMNDGRVPDTKSFNTVGFCNGQQLGPGPQAAMGHAVKTLRRDAS
jgi:hypothetical protein